MSCNVGGVDRILRIVLGVALLLYGYLNSSWWGLVGIVPILTGSLRFCPLYPLIKLNTAGKDKE
jgi:hypothetical protein